VVIPTTWFLQVGNGGFLGSATTRWHQYEVWPTVRGAYWWWSVEGARAFCHALGVTGTPVCSDALLVECAERLLAVEATW
jgi:hypothetical protein